MTHTTILEQRPVPANAIGLRGRWGCRPSSILRRPVFSALPSDEWDGCDLAAAILPSDYQTEGSCTCYSFCTALEALYRLRDGADVIPAPYQIDAQRLYVELNRWYYNDAERDEGAEIDMPVAVAQRLRLIPPDTIVQAVELSPSALAHALHDGPVLVGTAVGGAYMYSCNAETGEVPHEVMTDETILGGHAYALIGIQRDSTGKVWLRFSNSWSNWGLNGQCVLEWSTFVELWRPFGGLPLSLVMGEMWHGWRLPQDWLIRR